MNVGIYYLSNEKGYVQVIAGTTPNLFGERKSELYDLLNGLDFEGETHHKVSGDGELDDKLTKLKDLYDKGLITQDDYDKKRAEILEDF